MDIGDYYSKSINGFTKNPLLAVPYAAGNILMAIIGIAIVILMFALYGSDIAALSQYSTSTMATPDLSTIYTLMGIFLIIIVIIGIISWIVTGIINAATIGMSKKIVLGERPDLSDAIHYIKKYLIKILAVSFIFGLLIVFATIPFILGGFLMGFYPNNDLIILGPIVGGLITLILWIGLFLFFIFTFQSVIVGKKSIIGSFKDSYKLVKKNILEVIIVLIINLLIIIAIFVVLTVINLILAIIPIIGPILNLIIQILIYSLVYPFLALVLSHLYMDLKNMIPEKEEYVY